MPSTKEATQDTLWRRRGKKSGKIDEANASVLGAFPKGKSVLEVGCGAGTLLSALKKQGRRVIGVDLSNEAVQLAKAKGLNVRKIDVDKPLPFKDGAFEVVVCVQVLQHVYSPQALLKEIARVSKKYVVVNAPNHLWWRRRLGLLFGRFQEDLFGSSGHIRQFTPSSLRALVEEAGLKVVRTSCTGGVPLLEPVFGGKGQTAALWPGLFATSVTLVCKKR